MTSDNVVSLNSDHFAPGLTSARIQQLKSACRARTRVLLQKAMISLFDHIDDELYHQAEKSLNDTLQTSYFEAMRELRFLRRKIIDSFLDRNERLLEAYVCSGGAEVPAPCSRAGDDLSLVNEEQLEEDLAVMNVISKSENRYWVDLDSLNKRMALLCGYGDGQAMVNPLSPAVMAESFRSALDLWSGDLLVKLVIYKLFDKHVMTEVGRLYKNLNEMLVDARVLPKLPRSVRNPQSGSSAGGYEPGSGREHHALPRGTTETAGASLTELVAQIQSLATEQRLSLGLPEIPEVDDHTAPRVQMTELVDVLGRMQATYVLGSPFNLSAAQQTNSQFKQALVDNLGVSASANSRRQLDKSDQHIIDVVMMLFDFVLDDPLMADPMKVLLGRLQIPMLRAAVTDRSFLSDKYHPARSLLNNLARAAIRWEDDGRSRDSLFGRIELAIDRILKEFDGVDIGIFEIVDKQFMSYVAKENRGARIAEERLSQVARGKEQLSVARTRVSRELDARMGCDLPEPAFRILDEGWRDVLTLTLLREGEESHAWKRGLKLAEDLIDSVRFHEAEWERKRVMARIPGMLRELRAGFQSVSYDPGKTERMFKELQMCHINAMRGAVSGVANEPASAPRPDASGTADAVQKVDDQFSRWAADLRKDQWIIWQGEDGGRIRVKLAWRSQLADVLLFVNRKGQEMLELTEDELATAARSGRATPVKDISVPIVDRALRAISDLLLGAGGGGMVANPV